MTAKTGTGTEQSGAGEPDDAGRGVQARASWGVWPERAFELRERIARAHRLLSARQRRFARAATLSAYIAVVSVPLCIVLGVDLFDVRVDVGLGLVIGSCIAVAVVAKRRMQRDKQTLEQLNRQAESVRKLIEDPPRQRVREAALWTGLLDLKATSDTAVLSGLLGRNTEGPDLELAQRDDEHAIDIETMRALQADAHRYNIAGRTLIGAAVVLGVLLLVASHFVTLLYVHDLNEAEDGTQMLILLLVRGTLFGGLAVGLLYGVFSIANAYIDQATRFRKRLYSAHMLNYAFRQFASKISDSSKVTVGDLVALFSAWNANVDSAFTGVTFQKDSKNLVIGTKDAKLAVEGAEPQPKAHGDTIFHVATGPRENGNDGPNAVESAA